MGSGARERDHIFSMYFLATCSPHQYAWSLKFLSMLCGKRWAPHLQNSLAITVFEVALPSSTFYEEPGSLISQGNSGNSHPHIKSMGRWLSNKIRACNHPRATSSPSSPAPKRTKQPPQRAPAGQIAQHSPRGIPEIQTTGSHGHQTHQSHGPMEGGNPSKPRRLWKVGVPSNSPLLGFNHDQRCLKTEYSCLII